MASLKTPKGIIYFKQKQLFPGCHIIDRRIAFDNLCLINSVISKTNIKWGVAFGTLLGIYRDGDFIEWDEDTDLYILKEEENMFLMVLWDLIEVGFELIRYERAGLYSIMRKGEYIDFYVLNKVSDDLRFTSDGCFIFEKFIKEDTVLDFKGIDLRIPQNVEEYLSLEYGDWQKPVRYYSPKVGFLKHMFHIAYSYFRLYAPDFLYYYWIKSLRSADLEKYKQKCQKRGYSIDANLKIDFGEVV